jgi:hypothetical protein
VWEAHGRQSVSAASDIVAQASSVKAWEIENEIHFQL